MKHYDNFELQEAQVSDLASALDNLTVYEEKSVFVNDRKQGAFKAIWNTKNGEAVAIPSKQFALIQHKDAFKLVVDSLATTGRENVKFELKEQGGKAWLYVVFPELTADDGESKIELGFRVKNSVTGDGALTFRADRKFHDAAGNIEFFGRRQVCANGMTIKVPLAEIMAGDKLVAERVFDVAKKLAAGYIVHKGDAQARLLDLKALVDSIALSIPSINAIIAEAQSIGKERSFEEAKKMLEENGFGERLVDFVMEKYVEEQELKNYSNYELYNAVTYYASHKQKSANAAENLLKKAQVLLAPARVR